MCAGGSCDVHYGHPFNTAVAAEVEVGDAARGGGVSDVKIGEGGRLLLERECRKHAEWQIPLNGLHRGGGGRDP